MNYEDLISFKENIADPAQRKIFDSTELKEGMGFIDSLEINYLNGRNCGYDKRIKACGLEYVDGKVETCEFEEFDVPLADFLKQIKYPFIFGGTFFVSDEIEPIEISTQIGLFKQCAAIYDELNCLDKAVYLGNSREYQKMLYIHGETPEEEPSVDLKL